MLATAGSWYVPLRYPNFMATLACYPQVVVGRLYGVLNYGFAAACGVSSSFLSLLAMVLFLKKRRKIQTSNHVITTDV